MAETTNILKAVTAQWNGCTTPVLNAKGTTAPLNTYQLRSTRIPAQTNGSVPPGTFPYAVLKSAVLGHLFWSGLSKLTDYRVTILAHCGNTKAIVDSMENALEKLFDFNIGLPLTDNCYVVSVVPLTEDPELDDDDFYGSDISTLVKVFRVQLNETRPAVNKTLAT